MKCIRNEKRTEKVTYRKETTIPKVTSKALQEHLKLRNALAKRDKEMMAIQKNCRVNSGNAYE